MGEPQHKRAILQKYQTFYLNQDQQHWWQYHWSCIVWKFFTQTLFGNQQEKFTFCYEYYFLLVCPKCRRFPFWWLNWVWKGKVAPLLVLPSSTMDLWFCCFFTSWIFTHPRTSITHHHRHPRTITHHQHQYISSLQESLNLWQHTVASKRDLDFQQRLHHQSFLRYLLGRHPQTKR